MPMDQIRARTAALKAGAPIPSAAGTRRPPPARKALPVLLPCGHEGRIITPCHSCGGDNRHVRDCEIHGTCTRIDAGKDVDMVCARCPDHTARKTPAALPAPAPGARETVVGDGSLCVVTLNIGHVMGATARASMLAAAKRWGAAYAEIHAPIREVGGKPHWQKAFLPEWARERGYTRVAYYDSDIVLRSDCPNIFDRVPAGSVGIVSNQQQDFAELSSRQHRRYDSDRRWWAARLGGKMAPAERHVNGGLIVFEPVAHADLFRRWAEAGASVKYGRADVLVDEAALSIVLENSDVPRVWLPSTFNLLFYRSPSLNNSRDMAGFAYHGAGRGPKHKLEHFRWDLTATEPPFSWRDIKNEGMFDFQDVYSAQVERVSSPAAFVELGSWRGKSSCFMAELIRASGKPIRFYCVDIWTGTPTHKWMRDAATRAGGDMLGVWRENLKRAGVLEFATPIQEDSARAARHFADGSLDFVYVDADHSFAKCVADIRAWRPKLKPGGVMAGHDFDMPDVARAVAQEFGAGGFTVTGRTWVAGPARAPGPD